MLAYSSRFGAIAVGALLAILVAQPAPGAAQDASSAAAAEALFREGRQLMDAHRYSEACPKFQASYELDVALGTLLNLANCFELSGQLASAWARFVEAETLARRAGDQRAQVARDRAAMLEPRLVRVRVTVAGPVEGLRIVIGGREFSSAMINTAIPIDPGQLTLNATAPHYEPFAQSFEATEEGSTVNVEVPPLVPAEEPAEQLTARRAPREETSSGGSPVGWIVGGVGVAALGVGVGFGVSANALWDPAACPRGTDGTRRCTTAAAQDDAETARSRANVSTALVTTGGVLVAAGIVLIVALHGDDEDDASASRVLVTPVANANGAGLVVGGSF